MGLSVGLTAVYCLRISVLNLRICNLTIKGPCIVKYIPIIIQKDANIYGLCINRSTCFVWYLHPSSGAHATVSTASGVSKTQTPTRCERGWMRTAILLSSKINCDPISHENKKITNSCQ